MDLVSTEVVPLGIGRVFLIFLLPLIFFPMLFYYTLFILFKGRLTYRYLTDYHSCVHLRHADIVLHQNENLPYNVFSRNFVLKPITSNNI